MLQYVCSLAKRVALLCLLSLQSPGKITRAVPITDRMMNGSEFDQSPKQSCRSLQSLSLNVKGGHCVRDWSSTCKQRNV